MFISHIYEKLISTDNTFSLNSSKIPNQIQDPYKYSDVFLKIIPNSSKTECRFSILDQSGSPCTIPTTNGNISELSLGTYTLRVFLRYVIETNNLDLIVPALEVSAGSYCSYKIYDKSNKRKLQFSKKNRVVMACENCDQLAYSKVGSNCMHCGVPLKTYERLSRLHELKVIWNKGFGLDINGKVIFPLCNLISMVELIEPQLLSRMFGPFVLSADKNNHYLGFQQSTSPAALQLMYLYDPKLYQHILWDPNTYKNTVPSARIAHEQTLLQNYQLTSAQQQQTQKKTPKKSRKKPLFGISFSSINELDVVDAKKPLDNVYLETLDYFRYNGGVHFRFNLCEPDGRAKAIKVDFGSKKPPVNVSEVKFTNSSLETFLQYVHKHYSKSSNKPLEIYAYEKPSDESHQIKIFSWVEFHDDNIPAKDTEILACASCDNPLFTNYRTAAGRLNDAQNNICPYCSATLKTKRRRVKSHKLFFSDNILPSPIVQGLSYILGLNLGGRDFKIYVSVKEILHLIFGFTELSPINRIGPLSIELKKNRNYINLHSIKFLELESVDDRGEVILPEDLVD